MPIKPRTISAKINEADIEDNEKNGVEEEKDDFSSKIIRPFDPEKIKVSTTTSNVSLLLSRMDHKEIDLAPEFQRRARIWDIGRKSRLIESLLLRIPLPVFYVAADKSDNWIVVDGLQRLTTLHDFANGKFGLVGLEYLIKFEEMKWDELPRNMIRRIIETEMHINVIDPHTPEEVMFNIFKRINTAGMSLNSQEIRHALNKGPARAMLLELANSNAFLNATDNSINDQRMAARECILRFLAFKLMSWETYNTSDLNGFLNTAMKDLNTISTLKIKNLKLDFKRAMEAAFSIFDKDAFRKRFDENAPRSPVSRALFEAWAVNFSILDDNRIERLIQKKEKIRKGFMELMNKDTDFVTSISLSTGAPNRVKKRFSTIENLIKAI